MTNSLKQCAGWWLGEESERCDGPLLSEPQWDSVLRANGFSGVDGSVQTSGDGHSLSSVMLATATSDLELSFPDLSLVRPNVRRDDSLTRTMCELLSTRAARTLSVDQLLSADLNGKYAIVLGIEDSFWLDIDEMGLEKMQSIFQVARGILWVTRGASNQHPSANMVTGLARSIRREDAGLRFSTLDFDASVLLSDDSTAELILKVANHVFNSERSSLAADVEFKEISGLICIPRVLSDKRKDDFVVRETRPPVPQPEYLVQEGRPLKLKLGQIGQLDSMYFVADETLQLPLSEDDVEISIKATGINFKDIMISLGQVPYNHDLGLECSGVVDRVGSKVQEFRVGDRVCGMAFGSYASSVRVKSSRVVGMPPDMTFSEAASFPMVFCTAHYSLLEMGRLCAGEKVLIHAAAGGVGQVAIMLAQDVKAEIYATVSSTEKRSLLLETYGIPEDHIFSSRDTSFARELMKKTNQRGVDVILNSTAGEILHESWRCLAPLGRFLEIGKRDIVKNANLEMEKFADSVSFISVDLGIILEAKPQIIKQMLQNFMELHQRKIVRPITPIKTLSMSELSQGMRTMQSGKHVGKVVVEVNSNDIVQVGVREMPCRLMLIISSGYAGPFTKSLRLRRCNLSHHRRHRRLGKVDHQMARW